MIRSFELARRLVEVGAEVFFACESGAWCDLLEVYGIQWRRIFEARVQKDHAGEIGLYLSEELETAYYQDLNLIEKTSPDLVVTDWRITAPISCARAGACCVQILNYNWRRLSDFNSRRRMPCECEESRICDQWLTQVHSLALAVGQGQVDPTPTCKWTIIPDEELFRRASGREMQGRECFCGPLVPLPGEDLFREVQKSYALVIAFGGHDLGFLQARVKEVAKEARLALDILSRSTQELVAAALPGGEGLFPRQLLGGEVVITHGGSGTIYQALAAGRPVLVLPQHIEHRVNAQCAERLGVGLGLDPELLDSSSLKEAFHFLTSGAVRRACEKYQRLLRSLDSFSHAVAIITTAVSTARDRGNT